DSPRRGSASALRAPKADGPRGTIGNRERAARRRRHASQCRARTRPSPGILPLNSFPFEMIAVKYDHNDTYNRQWSKVDTEKSCVADMESTNADSRAL